MDFLEISGGTDEDPTVCIVYDNCPDTQEQKLKLLLTSSSILPLYTCTSRVQLEEFYINALTIVNKSK